MLPPANDTGTVESIGGPRHGYGPILKTALLNEFEQFSKIRGWLKEICLAVEELETRVEALEKRLRTAQTDGAAQESHAGGNA